MNNKETKKRVSELCDSIKTSQKELNVIRQNCSHDSYSVGNWSWRPGAIMEVRICNHCGDNIGAPSEEEYEKFMEDSDSLPYDGNEDMKT